MRPRFALAALVALHAAVACVVPTFDVEGPATATGGSNLTGGKGAGGNAGTGSTTGGASAKGGQGSVLAGGAGAGAEGAVGGVGEGEGGAGGASNPAGPTRVGSSVFHDSAAGDDEASSKLADATFSLPEGTAPGDLMLVFFGCDHQLSNLDASTLPPGWHVQDQQEGYGGDGQGFYLLYKFVEAVELDPVVFADINPVGSGNGVQGLLSVYRGVNANAPVHAYDKVLVKVGTDDTKHIVTKTPAITTTVDDCLLIAGLSPDTAIDAPVVALWPEGFDENRVSVLNPPTPYPNGWANIYSAERHLAKASTVPASAFEWDLTYGGSQYGGALAFVLALAPQ